MANRDENNLTATAEVTAIAPEQAGRRIYTVRGQSVMLDSDLARPILTLEQKYDDRYQ